MEFEAVYYSAPGPRSPHALTLLGLVFDRLYFPGVYVPSEGVDLEATRRELERLKALPQRGNDPDVPHMMNLMVCALNADHLKDFCVFEGRFGAPGYLQPGAKELVKEFEELIFGPPPENFFPSYPMGFSKGLPGDHHASVNGPSWLTYPVNAIVYAHQTERVLVNDSPRLPVLSLGTANLKGNAKQLATVLSSDRRN
jgi:hypothetical protein